VTCSPAPAHADMHRTRTHPPRHPRRGACAMRPGSSAKRASAMQGHRRRSLQRRIPRGVPRATCGPRHVQEKASWSPGCLPAPSVLLAGQKGASCPTGALWARGQPASAEWLVLNGPPALDSEFILRAAEDFRKLWAGLTVRQVGEANVGDASGERCLWYDSVPWEP